MSRALMSRARSASISKQVRGLFLVGLAASCVPAPVKEQIDRQGETILSMQRVIADLKLDISRQGAHLENLDRMWWSERLCRNPKNPEFPKRVAQFMNEVQAGIPGTCQQGPLENAMFFMRTQVYCNSYLRPTEPVDAMHFARKGQLVSLLDPKYIYPSTRFLVLVQPTQESEAAHLQALEIGKQYVSLMRRLAPETNLRILGPHLLPCRLRSEVRRLFNGPMDGTLPEEPQEGTPRVRVWTWRTDCN